MKKCRCKLDGKEFNDTTNASGALISHLQKNYPNVEIPSKWKRAKVFKETGHYWHEQYFEIFEVEEKIKRTERVFDEVAICQDYIEGAGVYDLCAKYQIGKIRVKDILARNNVPLKTVGAQKTRTYNFEYTENKYNETEEYSYIAICKIKNSFI